ncbi:MAG: sugar phosphate isomerase/epimerase family protein [Candidatus Fervidibacter sp.]|uniref:sugar phosphate isomerase/epimerase family protein n=1 Tax=Candidatus Fervidibacter sp. TaxID=3100871 RepID=UPI00404B0DA7
MFQTRREFLQRTVGTLLTATAGWGQEKRGERKMEWKLGLQSYSLRTMPFEKAVATTKQLGLTYLEAFPAHLPMEKSSEAKKVLNEYEVKLIAYGVVRMTNNLDAMRRLFDFAKSMDIEILSADPDPDSFDLLDKLVDEYGIHVAIHNHGPGSRYPGVDSVLKAIEGHHERIGLCYDTGHGARAGDDIVEAVRKIGKRIYGAHLKDVNEQKRDVVVGTGILDIKGFLKALKGVGFKGALMLEYELEPENPVPGIQKSLEFIRKALTELS